MLPAFQSELAALDRFIEILQREQAALVHIDVHALMAITPEKLKQAELLNRLAQARVSALAALGVGGDRLEIEAWLKTQPADMTEAWNTLLTNARAAQHLNQTNGGLIESQLKNNQQALNALVSAANQSSVYGADGQPRTTYSSSQRTLGKG